MSDKSGVEKSGSDSERNDGRHMPALRSDDSKVIAILCSDMHLSLRAPCCRKESDWLEAILLTLKELKMVSLKYDAPIIFAGDLFDYWKAEPELITFAMKHIPENFWAIPGQHDLPLHNMDLMHRSAFYTLATSGHIKWLARGPVKVTSGLIVHPFAWGEEIIRCPKQEDESVHLAVAHEYLWTDGSKYPGAPEQGKASGSHMARILKGYSAAVFGDNHGGFLTTIGKVPVLNAGGMMRRKSDERHYTPQLGLLLQSGDIRIHKLETSEELMASSVMEPEDEGEDTLDIHEFLVEMQELKGSTFDFREAMEAAFRVKDIREKVKTIILEAMENER